MKQIAIVLSLLICIPIFPAEDLPQSIVYKERTRSYIVHLPTGYKKDTAHALVLVLHGGGGSAKGTPRLTGFNEKSDREGFLVVYPNGTGRLQEHLLTWNAGNCCGYALDHRVDDAGFLRELILNLKKEFRILAISCRSHRQVCAQYQDLARPDSSAFFCQHFKNADYGNPNSAYDGRKPKMRSVACNEREVSAANFQPF